MGISKERGVVATWFTDKPFNRIEFAKFLTQIPTCHAKPTYLFLDNASYHTCPDSLHCMARLGFKAIFNAPYNCEFNPAESVFGMVKAHYRRLRY